jgi:hypothetical protein
MQDEYGRPLSDDGQWVWDGSAWRSTGGGAAPQDPATTGYEPTQVAPRDYGPQSGTQASYGGAPSGPQDYYARPGQASYPGGPVGPGGPGLPPPPTPWWKRPVTIIGALLVLSAVLVTVILLTRGDNDSTATPSASVTPSVSPSVSPSAAPTTDPPTPAPTTPSPVDTPTPSPSRTPLVPAQVEPGIYDCTQAGQATGQTISFSGLAYTTNTGAVGTYTYTRSTGAISFTGGDLGPYTGTYNASGPSLDLQASGVQLHCAQ